MGENALIYPSYAKKFDRHTIYRESPLADNVREGVKSRMSIQNSRPPKLMAGSGRITRSAGSILQIPDELLLQIFYFFLDAPALSTLAAVCTRFRYLLLQAPRAWANCHISTRDNLRNVKALLQRSGSLPLTIKIFIGEEYQFFQSFTDALDELSKYLDRWEDVTVRDKGGGLIHPILMREVELRALRRLSLVSVDGGDAGLFERWSMPCLEHLYCLGTSLSKPLRAPRLRSCTLTLNGEYRGHDVQRLLSSLVDLEILQFKFLHIDVKPRFAAHTLTFGSLRSLEIRTHYIEPYRPIVGILGRIAFPNLTELKLNVDFAFPLWRECLSLHPKLFKLVLQPLVSLRHFTLQMMSRVEAVVDLDWERLSFIECAPQDRTPRIDCMTLEIQNVPIPWRGGYVKDNSRESFFSYAQTLRFVNCNLMDEDYFDTFAKNLKGHGVELNKVQIVECPRVRREVVECLFRKAGVIKSSIPSSSTDTSIA